MSRTDSVLSEVFNERTRQNEKWGEQNYPPADYLMILGEEVGEVNRAALEAWFAKSEGDHEKHAMEYRAELIQVAAVAVAMVECFDRRKAPVHRINRVKP